MFVELSSFIMLEKCFFPQLARCDVMHMSQIRTFFKSSNRVFYVLHYSLCCWQLVTLVQYSLAVSPWTISLCGQGSPLVSAIRLNVLLCTCRSKCHRVWRCFLSCEINHSKWKTFQILLKMGEKKSFRVSQWVLSNSRSSSASIEFFFNVETSRNKQRTLKARLNFINIDYIDFMVSPAGWH